MKGAQKVQPTSTRVMPRRMLRNATLVSCLLVLTGLSIPAPGLRADSLPPGDSQHFVMVDSIRHDYFLHLPVSAAPGPWALVVALRGAGPGSIQDFEETVNFSAASDRHNFVLAMPEAFATEQHPVRTWNAGSCCGGASALDIDHVAALKAIVEDVAGLVPIDLGRVFAIGHSNGGMMAYRLACEAADTFAAIAVSSGYLMDMDVDADPPEPVFTCEPDEYVGIQAYHGLLDQCGHSSVARAWVWTHRLVRRCSTRSATS